MTFQSVMPPYGASDPEAQFVGSSCLDFLLIEMVPMAYRVANELEAGGLESATNSSTAVATATETTVPAQDTIGTTDGKGGAVSVQPAGSGASIKSGIGTAGATTVSDIRKMDEDEERDAVFYRLEMLGYRVGQGLAERYLKPLRPSFLFLSFPFNCSIFLYCENWGILK